MGSSEGGRQFRKLQRKREKDGRKDSESEGKTFDLLNSELGSNSPPRRIAERSPPKGQGGVSQSKDQHQHNHSTKPPQIAFECIVNMDMFYQ